MKTQLLYMILGTIVLVHAAKASPDKFQTPLTFAQADAIVVADGDASAAKQKLDAFKTIAARDTSMDGIHAQERMIDICSRRLYGEKPEDATDYIRALTNQTIDKAKRIHAFEMLGAFYKKEYGEGVNPLDTKDVAAKKKEALSMAKQCFERARSAYPEGDTINRGRLMGEISSINKLLAGRE